jgi:hypothetical protein
MNRSLRNITIDAEIFVSQRVAISLLISKKCAKIVNIFGFLELSETVLFLVNGVISENEHVLLIILEVYLIYIYASSPCRSRLKGKHPVQHKH